MTPISESTSSSNLFEKIESNEPILTKRRSSIENLRENKAAKRFKSLTQSESAVEKEEQDYVSHFTLTHSGNKSIDYDLRVVLEYPGRTQAETFLLLKPNYERSSEQNDIYDPIADLIRSANLISENYMTGHQRELLGGTLIDLETYEKRRSAEGFALAVSKFNRVLKKLKEDGAISKNARQIRSPSFELICHIMFQIYSRTVAWRAEILNAYPPFSDQVYGEIFPPLVDDIVTKTKINANSVFIDLGCGIGNVVLQVAAQTGCESYGVEVMSTPCKLAKRQLKEYAARMRAWHLPTGKIHLYEADFLDILSKELSLVFENCNVILVNNHSFTPTTNHALVQLFSRLPEGTRIVSLSSFVPKNHKINNRTINMPESILQIEKYEYKAGWVSWTGNSGPFYISTVNRSRLESYLDESNGH